MSKVRYSLFKKPRESLFLCFMEPDAKPYRKIIHIDMDAFYASVEQRDDPQLRGKPVIVGGETDRGVVAAASYEARKFGIHSAMPTKMARQRCPELVIVKHRFDVYTSISKQIRKLFTEYTDLVEPLSLDEAFLDVTSNKKGILSATLIARELKKRIKEETQLTASAGVSFNKFLAKVASDMKKPDGLYVIPPEKAEQFVAGLEIEKFFGIGRVTAGKMHDLGIRRGADLKKWDKADLIRIFGKNGSYFYDIARAVDNRPVNPERIRKSIGTEYTYEKDLETVNEIESALYSIERELNRRITKAGRSGRTLTLKIKFSDFQQITRSMTIPGEINDLDTLRKISKEILRKTDLSGRKIRLLGLTVSNLEEENDHEDTQLTLDL